MAQKKGSPSKYYSPLAVHLGAQELWWRCTARLLLSYLLCAQLCPTPCDLVDCSLQGSSWGPWGFTRQEYWSGLPCPPPGTFPTQGSNTGLLYCRRILYCLSHQGSPRILEWVAYPFAKGSSQATSQTGVSCIAGSSLPAELPGKPPHLLTHIYPETHWSRSNFDFQDLFFKKYILQDYSCHRNWLLWWISEVNWKLSRKNSSF